MLLAVSSTLPDWTLVLVSVCSVVGIVATTISNVATMILTWKKLDLQKTEMEKNTAITVQNAQHLHKIAEHLDIPSDHHSEDS